MVTKLGYRLPSVYMFGNQARSPVTTFYNQDGLPVTTGYHPLNVKFKVDKIHSGLFKNDIHFRPARFKLNKELKQLIDMTAADLWAS